MLLRPRFGNEYFKESIELFDMDGEKRRHDKAHQRKDKVVMKSDYIYK